MAPDSGKTQPTDVIIVGSGPTGLMAANLLARCGVRVRILDKNEQQAHESRAFGVQAKSLELMLSIGLADQLGIQGYLIRPDGYIAYRTDGLDLAGLKRFIGGLTGGESG